jgi:acyl-CoA synthetase (AMP-forming)/AMP-acid ligase II/acyl carrier protein
MSATAEASNPSSYLNLADLLCQRAQQLGEKPLFRFVRGDNGSESTVTYRSLHESAMAVASRLQSMVNVGDRAWLMFPPGLDFVRAFFGCLYAGVVAVPVSPLRRGRPTSSLEGIYNASQPAVVLSTAAHSRQAEVLYEGIPELLRRPWIATDDIEIGDDFDWINPRVDGQQLAFLQYTSGSTAAPKGVMLTHENLLHNSELVRQAFGNTDRSSAVFWLPLYHDMGLIGGIIQPIYCAGTSTLLAPAAFLHRPALWLETISKTRATVSGGPNFAYDLCARKITAAEREGLDLSCWEVAFTGAEPVRARTLERFAAAFSEHGFREEAFFPCYGLAEATLIVSGGPRAARPTVLSLDADALALNQVRDTNGKATASRLVVGCGTSLPGQRIVVVDPETHVSRSAGQVGEIWVRGPSVARGYFEQPHATKNAFEAQLADSGEGPFLRTGDLGFVRDDQLFVTGRLKDLIIIRGRNYYPEDIEQTAQHAYEGLRVGYCAAFSVEVDERESLVIVQEIEPRRRDLDTDAALRAIRRAVAKKFDLEVHAIILAKAGTIAKTTSGKTRRSACRDRYLGGQQDVIAQWTADATEEGDDVEPSDGLTPRQDVTAHQIEEWLVERISARLKVPRSSIRVTTPFLEFGLGSLDAVQISADLERWLGRQLSPTAVYNHPNIEDLARWLASPDAQTDPVSSSPIPAPPPKEEDPDQLLRQIQGLSQEEMEEFIQREMAKQKGT